jgi:hypothetical protein
MRDLIYKMGVSLDGFVAGPDGEIDWSAPDEELHRFHNEQIQEFGVQLCGRRLYETMLYWETADETPSAAEHELEFARIWKALPKVVFSTTLEKVEGNATLATDSVAEGRRQAEGATGQGPGRRRSRPGLQRDKARPDRRVPAVRQPRRTGRRHALLPGPGRAAQPGAGGDPDVRLARRIPALPARVAGLAIRTCRRPSGHGCSTS